ncbi:MAG: endolytic transglycosylase MltG [Endomicrobiia bacterium]|nr:endolytic transglycosylase MltG [Endomicrobiia bacterium]
MSNFNILFSSRRWGAILACVLLALAGFFYLDSAVLRNDLKGKTLVEIPRNVSASRAAEILGASGAVKSPRFFLYWLKFRGSAARVKAGVYVFAPRESVFCAASKLVRGESHRIRLTVPEGADSARIARLAEAAGLGGADGFLAYVKKNNLEGVLFPETYFFEYGSDGEVVARRMKEEFDRRVTPEILTRAKEIGLDIRRMVILASIIEKEATPNDRRLVSAVFHNRLKKGMYLESCATVLYALGVHKEKLTYSDLRVRSPYNTYIHYGLPPGPISNPGMDSILAAVYPEDSDALFFVINSASGTHIFSSYYKEHIEAQRERPRRRR